MSAAGYAGFDISRGEANNTGDLIEAALLLGQAGYRQYFEDADRMLRNHLLASQVVDTSWVQEARGYDNDAETLYGEVARRTRGGFCFGSPNGLISYPGEVYQVNADLVGGALQAICESWEAIARLDGNSARVDLLFSKEDKALSVTCPAPGPDPITLRLNEAKTLQVRIPAWAQPSGVGFQVNNMRRQSALDLVKDGYLTLRSVEAGDLVKIWLPSRRETISEVIDESRYEVEWHNDTVVGIRPPAQFKPLYGSA